jgi:hypothetical protein
MSDGKAQSIIPSNLIDNEIIDRTFETYFLLIQIRLVVATESPAEKCQALAEAMQFASEARLLMNNYGDNRKESYFAQLKHICIAYFLLERLAIDGELKMFVNVLKSLRTVEKQQAFLDNFCLAIDWSVRNIDFQISFGLESDFLASMNTQTVEFVLNAYNCLLSLKSAGNAREVNSVSFQRLHSSTKATLDNLLAMRSMNKRRLEMHKLKSDKLILAPLVNWEAHIMLR